MCPWGGSCCCCCSTCVGKGGGRLRGCDPAGPRGWSCRCVAAEVTRGPAPAMTLVRRGEAMPPPPRYTAPTARLLLPRPLLTVLPLALPPFLLLPVAVPLLPDGRVSVDVVLACSSAASDCAVFGVKTAWSYTPGVGMATGSADDPDDVTTLAFDTASDRVGGAAAPAGPLPAPPTMCVPLFGTLTFGGTPDSGLSSPTVRAAACTATGSAHQVDCRSATSSYSLSTPQQSMHTRPPQPSRPMTNQRIHLSVNTASTSTEATAESQRALWLAMRVAPRHRISTLCLYLGGSLDALDARREEGAGCHDAG